MRFLFSCVPLEGHLRPLLPLARALRERGHTLAFATAPSIHGLVEEMGFPALPVGVAHADAAEQYRLQRVEIEALPPERRRPLMFSALFARGHAPRRLADLRAAATSWNAEALVYESADLAAPIVGAALGLPTVNHAFGAMVPLAALERAAEDVAPLWCQAGAEPEPYAGAFRGLFVDISPPSFRWEEPLGEVTRLRPVTVSAMRPPSWLAALPRPLVYVTLGTVYATPELFRPLLEGLEGVSAVVTTGRALDPAELGPVPEHVRVERFVPQGAVLGHADAAITHGGSGSTLGALAHGLPLVVVPQGADQFDNADRAATAGAALVLRPDEVTPARVRDALRRVLEDLEFRRAAGAVAAEIDAMPAPVEAAGAVERHVTRR